MEKMAPRVVVAWLAGFCTSMVLSRLLWHNSEKEQEQSDNNQHDDILSVIKRRRSIFPKQYSSKAVPRRILEEMLEASRWAPTHKLTEPWEYIIFASAEARGKLGQFLAHRYKVDCDASGKEFSQSKYDKKIANASKSSFVIAIICDTTSQKNPVAEEICSVAMSVQNMLLMATAHEVGAYWSSGSVHEKRDDSLLVNPVALREFLELDRDDNKKVCMGWIFIGDYYGDSGSEKRKWPEGRRRDMSEQRITWK